MQDSSDQASAGVRQIGSYQVVGVLGSSNMAVVYRAFDPVVERSLAVKMLRIPSPAAEKEIREARLRFESEVQTLSRLSPHENIPILYHFGEDDRGVPYFAMELIPGDSLDERIAGGKTLCPDAAVAIFRQIARALDYAHSKGIVHRDIKPRNVLLQPDGRVKIIDFGIARVGSQNLTATGARLGTPAYMSPEQIKGANVGGLSDQFSLAVLAYRVLTGKMPFEGQDESVHYNILHSDPPPPSRVNPVLPTRLDDVLLRALKKTQGDRFETCGVFVAALDRALLGSSDAETAETTRRTGLPAGRRSRILEAVLAALVCLALLGGLSSWIWTKVMDRRAEPKALVAGKANADQNGPASGRSDSAPIAAHGTQETATAPPIHAPSFVPDESAARLPERASARPSTPAVPEKGASKTDHPLDAAAGPHVTIPPPDVPLPQAKANLLNSPSDSGSSAGSSNGPGGGVANGPATSESSVKGGGSNPEVGARSGRVASRASPLSPPSLARRQFFRGGWIRKQG